MKVIAFKRMNHNVRRKIEAALKKVEGRARERKLTVGEVVALNKETKAGDFGYWNGGHVPSSYNYSAATTFAVVVSLGRKGRVVVIGRQDAYKPTISRALGGKCLGQGNSPKKENVKEKAEHRLKQVADFV